MSEIETAAENTMDAFWSSSAGKLTVTLIFVGVTILVTWIIARIVNHFFQKAIRRLVAAGNSTADVVAFVRHIIIALVYFGGFAVIVSNIPALSSAMNKLLAAGGVLAVIAGLASQEALGSIVSGMMILTFKPFVIGDVIRYVPSDISGVVEEISLRHTVIRTWENRRLIVPNNTMNSAIIENADYHESKICSFFDVAITYESDLALAMKLLEETAAKHPDFYDNRTEEEKSQGIPLAPARVQELGSSAVVLRVSLWAKDNGTAYSMKCDLLRSVKEAFEKNGICIAYPHLVVMNQGEKKHQTNR